MKGTSGAKKTSTKTTTDEEEITSTSVEPTSAEKPVEETKSPAEQVQETATPTGNNPSATENKNPDYTMDDVVSVAETGSLPPVEPKSAYDMYMEEAKNIYNQGVETNNKNAANQAASAGAQYREVNRNVGEINKANGKADTGYAGDTSIDAYNAYRNSVNKSYSDANSANNELYSYYLTKMTELQQAKDTKEATDRQLEQTDRQLDMQEDQFEYDKIHGENGMLDTISGYIDENSYNENGTIKSETAKELWEYVKTYYGGEENIPKEVVATLNSEKGFSDWLAEYNNQTGNSDYESEYDKQNNITNYYEVRKIDKNGNASSDGKDFAVLKTSKTEGAAWDDDDNDNFRITYEGKVYWPEMGSDGDKLGTTEANLVKGLIEKANGRPAGEGDACYYDGRVYVVCNNGAVRTIQDRSHFWAWNWGTFNAGDLESAVKRNLGIG